MNTTAPPMCCRVKSLSPSVPFSCYISFSETCLEGYIAAQHFLFSLWVSWYSWSFTGEQNIVPMHLIKLYLFKHRLEESQLSKEYEVSLTSLLSHLFPPSTQAVVKGSRCTSKVYRIRRPRTEIAWSAAFWCAFCLSFVIFQSFYALLCKTRRKLG